MLAQQHRTARVDRHRSIPCLCIEIDDVQVALSLRLALQGCVIVHDIDAAVTGHCPLHEIRHGAFVRQVEAFTESAVDFRGDKVRSDNGRSISDHMTDSRFADATAGAGDDRHLALKPIRHFSAPLNMSLPIFHSTRSEEHTSELQSLMRISYAVFCLKKKTK